MRNGLWKYALVAAAFLLGGCMKNEYISITIDGLTVPYGNNLVGLVTDAVTGEGIEGVAVSDGYQWVLTDAKGVYYMVADERVATAQCRVPAGYAIPMDENKKSKPLIWGAVDMSTEADRVDFVLTPAAKEDVSLILIDGPACADSLSAVAWKTMVLYNVEAYADEVSNPCAIVLGDIASTEDMYGQMDRILGTVSSENGYFPVFTCIGDTDVASAYVEFFGPTDYAFDRGDSHIVVMNNVRSDFSGDQVEWLRQDVELVSDKASKSVILCTHLPFYASTSTNCASILNLLSSFSSVTLRSTLVPPVS